jgi:hypothetical protein
MDIFRPTDFYFAVYPIFWSTRILGLAPISLSDNAKNRHIKPSEAAVLYGLLLLTGVVTLYIISNTEEDNGNITIITKATKCIFDVREFINTAVTAVSIRMSCLNSHKIISISSNIDYIDRSMIYAGVQVSLKVSLRLFGIKISFTMIFITIPVMSLFCYSINATMGPVRIIIILIYTFPKLILV